MTTLVTVTSAERHAEPFRSSHLGASQVPAAIGVDPYCRPIELWERYTGTRPWDEAGRAAKLGNALEAGLVDHFADRLGLCSSTSRTLVHPRIPWLCATPDSIMADDAKGPTLLQIKTTGLASFQGEEQRDRWGDEGTDEVPVYVVAQVLTEMLVAHSHGIMATRCYVGALIAGRGDVLYEVPYDEEAARAVVSQAHAFWRLVESKTPPAVDGSEAFADYLKRRYPLSTAREIACEGADEDMIEAFTKLRDARKKAEVDERAARNALTARMADAEIMIGTRWMARYGTVKDTVKGTTYRKLTTKERRR